MEAYLLRTLFLRTPFEYGLRLLQPVLSAYLQAGGELRVLSTVYLGATDRRALDWLAERGEKLAGFDSTGYSDSINDLPLLEAVNTPVVVHADVRLAAIAADRGWKTLQLR